MRQDDILERIAEKVKNFAVIVSLIAAAGRLGRGGQPLTFVLQYVCDNKEVPDFNAMYELYDECTIMVCHARAGPARPTQTRRTD